jgi:hypothetical protein
MKPRVAVIAVAWLYLLVGFGVGIAVIPRLAAGQHDAIGMEITESIAAICGIFLLLHKGWARWLAVAWMGFHIVLSWPNPGKLIMHAILASMIAWALFRPESAEWFRRPAEERNLGQ